MNSFFNCFTLLLICLGAAFSASAEDTRDATAGIEFFESQVRPLLAKRCYKCHSAKSTSKRDGSFGRFDRFATRNRQVLPIQHGHNRQSIALCSRDLNSNS